MTNFNKYLTFAVALIVSFFLSDTIQAKGSNNSNTYAQSRSAALLDLSRPEEKPENKTTLPATDPNQSLLERSTITLSEASQDPATNPNGNVVISTTGVLVDFQTQNQTIVNQNTNTFIVNYVPVITGVAISCMVP